MQLWGTLGDMGIGDIMGHPQIGPYSGVVEKLPFGRLQRAILVLVGWWGVWSTRKLCCLAVSLKPYTLNPKLVKQGHAALGLRYGWLTKLWSL